MILIKTLCFAGEGSYTVEGNGLVKCDKSLIVEKNGNCYAFSTPHTFIDSKGINIVFGGNIGRGNTTVNYGSSFNNISNVSGSIIGASDGPVMMDNHRYKPYYIKKIGKKVYLPEGLDIQVEGEKISSSEDKKLDIKQFIIPEEVDVCFIETSAQASVKIDKSLISSNFLSIKTSGESKLVLVGSEKTIKELTISTSGESSFEGQIIASIVKVDSSGESRISGVRAKTKCSAKSSGESYCNIKADQGASIEKVKNGQSFCKISQ